MVGVFLLGFAANASADESVEALVTRGVAQYKAGDYAASVATLSRAYAIDPKARLLFNVARAEEKAGNLTDALAHYRTYVQASDAEPALVARAREGIARLEVTTAPPATSAAPAAPPPPQASSAPPPPSAPPAPVVVPPASPAPAPPPAPAAPLESPRPSALGWVALGVSGAALATGLGVGLWANSTADSARGTADPTEKPALRDAAYGRALAADVTMAVGAVLLTGALVYLFWPRHATSAKTASTLFVGLPL